MSTAPAMITFPLRARWPLGVKIRLPMQSLKPTTRTRGLHTYSRVITGSYPAPKNQGTKHGPIPASPAAMGIPRSMTKFSDSSTLR